MGTLPDIALLIAAILGSAVAFLLLYFLGRRLLNLWLRRRMDRRIKKVQAVLFKHQQEQFASMDRLLFQLGELHDLPAVETALQKTMEGDEAKDKLQLLKIYESLGLIDHYIKQLREATRWSDRATAAHALGQLKVSKAIPDLVQIMRDPHEDARTVKLAAAKALGLMEATEAVPLLITELSIVDEWASPRIAEVLTTFGVVAIPALLKALSSEEHINARVWAAQILGRIGVNAAEQQLIPLLRDRYEQVRMSAAEALGRLKSRQAINELIQVALRDPVAPVRAEAARALGSIGDENAVQSLALLLSDPDYWSRLRAIEAIEFISPADPSCLEVMLRDPSPEIRRRAAVALERVGMVTRRVDELAHQNTRAQAHLVLVEMGKAGLIESILAFLEYEDFRIRARIADVVGEIGEPRAVPILKTLLADTMWPVRARAVEAIAKLAPLDGPGLILPLLSDPEETVRTTAIQAIKNLSRPVDEPTLAAVIALFDNINAEIRASVVEAVGHLSHDSVAAMLEQAAVDPNADVRLRAVQAIVEQNNPRWLDTLISRLSDLVIEVRVAAVKGLGQIGSRPALEAMVRSLTTPDRQFRESLTSFLAERGVVVLKELTAMSQTKESMLALVWTLGKTRDPEAINELKRFAKNVDADIRAAIAGALGKIPHADAEQILLNMIGDRSERVRAAAVNALGNVGSVETVAKLILSLKDPDAFVRKRVALTLGRIGGSLGLGALDMARERYQDDWNYRAYIAAGFALCGGDEGFAKAIIELAQPEIQKHLEHLLDHEPEEICQQLRRNLHLFQEKSSAPITSAGLVENYAQTLKTDQNSTLRLAAIEALHAIDPEAHRELLMDAVLTDPVPEVRKAAIHFLSQGELTHQVCSTMEQALKDPAFEVQIEAAMGLGQSGNSAHNRALLSSLSTSEMSLHQALVQALVYNNRAHLLAFIDELMGYNDVQILCGGAEVLGTIGDPRSIGLLNVWLHAKMPLLRVAAARALGAIETLEAKEALMGGVSDINEEVRLVICEALTKIPGSDTLQALVGLCRDPSSRVRAALAQSIGRSRNTASLHLAETLCKDPEESIRVEALISLLMLRDVDALERFLKQLDLQPEAVRFSLSQTDPDHPAIHMVRELARADHRPAARIAALKALPCLGQRPLEVLLDAFFDPVPEVRIVAIEISAPLKDQTAMKRAIDRLLRDPEKQVRDAVRKLNISVMDAGS